MVDKTKVVDVLTPYAVSFIRKRCRNVETENVSAMTSVVIRSPGPDDAKIAFWLNCCALNRPHIPQTGRHEVVSYERRSWWPINPKNDLRNEYRSIQENRAIEENLSAEELLAILKQGYPDILGVNFDCFRPAPPTRIDELEKEVRVWKSNNLGQMQALVQKRCSENLMIWNGRAYALGGEPTYVQHPFTLRGDSDDGMASVGADRSLEPSASRLPIDIGRNEFGQRAFMRGWFQRADQYGLAKARRRLVSQEVSRVADYIDVVLPECLQLRPEEVRLDALFRAVYRVLAASTDRRLARLRATFLDAGARDCNSATTSADRYHALVKFRGFMDRRETFRAADEILRDAYESFKEFSYSGAFRHFEPVEMPEQDEQALLSLGQ